MQGPVQACAGHHVARPSPFLPLQSWQGPKVPAACGDGAGLPGLDHASMSGGDWPLPIGEIPLAGSRRTSGSVPQDGSGLPPRPNGDFRPGKGVVGCGVVGCLRQTISLPAALTHVGETGQNWGPGRLSGELQGFSAEGRRSKSSANIAGLVSQAMCYKEPANAASMSGRSSQDRPRWAVDARTSASRDTRHNGTSTAARNADLQERIRENVGPRVLHVRGSGSLDMRRSDASTGTWVPVERDSAATQLLPVSLCTWPAQDLLLNMDHDDSQIRLAVGQSQDFRHPSAPRSLRKSVLFGRLPATRQISEDAQGGLTHAGKDRVFEAPETSRVPPGNITSARQGFGGRAARSFEYAVPGALARTVPHTQRQGASACADVSRGAPRHGAEQHTGLALGRIGDACIHAVLRPATGIALHDTPAPVAKCGVKVLPGAEAGGDLEGAEWSEGYRQDRMSAAYIPGSSGTSTASTFSHSPQTFPSGPSISGGSSYESHRVKSLAHWPYTRAPTVLEHVPGHSANVCLQHPSRQRDAGKDNGIYGNFSVLTTIMVRIRHQCDMWYRIFNVIVCIMLLLPTRCEYCTQPVL